MRKEIMTITMQETARRHAAAAAEARDLRMMAATE